LDALTTHQVLNLLPCAQDRYSLDFITKASPKIADKARQYGLRIENRLPRLSEQPPQDSSPKPGNKMPSEPAVKDNAKLLCHIPWQQLLIDYDGSVRPDCLCRIDRSVVSSLAGLSLTEVWNNESMIEYRRRIVNQDYSDFCNPLCFSGKISESHLKIP